MHFWQYWPVFLQSVFSSDINILFQKLPIFSLTNNITGEIINCPQLTPTSACSQLINMSATWFINLLSYLKKWHRLHGGKGIVVIATIWTHQPTRMSLQKNARKVWAQIKVQQMQAMTTINQLPKYLTGTECNDNKKEKRDSGRERHWWVWYVVWGSLRCETLCEVVHEVVY